jgi:hypothetical protein
MAELLTADPLTAFIFLSAGGGILAVVIIFTRAQTIREREMWAAMQASSDNSRETNKDWLIAYKEQGDKSNESIGNLSTNVAALATQIAHLTAAVEKNNSDGASLRGATNLMVDYLKEGNGRRSEHK